MENWKNERQDRLGEVQGACTLRPAICMVSSHRCEAQHVKPRPQVPESCLFRLQNVLYQLRGRERASEGGREGLSHSECEAVPGGGGGGRGIDIKPAWARGGLQKCVVVSAGIDAI